MGLRMGQGGGGGGGDKEEGGGGRGREGEGDHFRLVFLSKIFEVLCVRCRKFRRY